jgi:hypothetical protein
VSSYAVRRATRSPRAFVRRRREKTLTAGQRVFYELHSYSNTFYAPMARQREHPDLLVDFPLDEQSVVVDGGAYVGGWSERIADRSGAKIHAFEPGAAAIRRFRARLGDRPNISLLEYGLGRVDGEVELSVRGPGSTVKAGTLT